MHARVDPDFVIAHATQFIDGLPCTFVLLTGRSSFTALIIHAIARCRAEISRRAELLEVRSCGLATDKDDPAVLKEDLW